MSNAVTDLNCDCEVLSLLGFFMDDSGLPRAERWSKPTRRRTLRVTVTPVCVCVCGRFLTVKKTFIYLFDDSICHAVHLHAYLVTLAPFQCHLGVRKITVMHFISTERKSTDSFSVRVFHFPSPLTVDQLSRRNSSIIRLGCSFTYWCLLVKECFCATLLLFCIRE